MLVANLLLGCQTMNLHTRVKTDVVNLLHLEAEDDIDSLNNALRLLSKWRSVLIQNTYLKMEGTKVFSGPLSGLHFVTESSEGCHLAKLIGTYEQPLHNYLMEFTRTDYEQIINIGCAEGYYAVGLTKLFPKAVSLAYDTDPIARNKCVDLAVLNHVQDRVEIHAEFSSHDFQRFKDNRALLICDIEGQEMSLFDQNSVPYLSGIDIIIESHDCFNPATTDTLVARFSDTHSISIVKDSGSRNLTNMPAWFENLSHLDQLLSIWEWRSGPTPWLVMRSKKSN